MISSGIESGNIGVINLEPIGGRRHYHLFLAKQAWPLTREGKKVVLKGKTKISH